MQAGAQSWRSASSILGTWAQHGTAHQVAGCHHTAAAAAAAAPDPVLVKGSCQQCCCAVLGEGGREGGAAKRATACSIPSKSPPPPLKGYPHQPSPVSQLLVLPCDLLRARTSITHLLQLQHQWPVCTLDLVLCLQQHRQQCCATCHAQHRPADWREALLAAAAAAGLL